ncbi:hypothetical protein DKX38_023835 [Salix brachista]|uniref:CCHC-type domain-containing protein n=1 Tax=Salix brachista TaxID=2182728 RepID=A0A5N5JLS9_9ROSI|nr:hypothetical protein DKX38_023835 [Salix brachista]
MANPRDAGHKDADADLWAAIDEQRHVMERMEAMIHRLEHRCGQEGHRSNECPTRRPVNLVDIVEGGEEEQYVGEELEMGELLEGAEIAKDVQGKVCNLIVDIGSCKNYISKRLFDMDVTYRGWENVYVFNWEGRKIVMVPKRSSIGVSTKATAGGHSLLSLVTSLTELELEIKEAREVHVVVMIAKGEEPEKEVPEKVPFLFGTFEVT